MTNTVWFTQAQLKAVAPFMSSEKVRYYLHGVYCDPQGVMVATDGHKLGAVKAGGVKSGAYIIPSDAVKQAIKLKEKSFSLVFTYNGNELTAYIATATQADDIANVETQNTILESADFTRRSVIVAKPVDGSFPDWRRVIPTETVENCPGVIEFNAGYLEAFIADGDKYNIVSVFPTASKGIYLILNANENFVGVLMGIRGGRDENAAVNAVKALTLQLEVA